MSSMAAIEESARLGMMDDGAEHSLTREVAISAFSLSRVTAKLREESRLSGLLFTQG